MAKVRYTLELRGKNKSSKKIVLPLVNRIAFGRQHAVTSVWTLGTLPYHQFAGIRGQHISLGGRSGVAARFETDGVTSTPSADMSGAALFAQFRDFMEEYEESAAKAQREGEHHPELVFRALWEDVNLHVTSRSFNWSRNTGDSRFSYNWSLELDSDGVADDYRDTGPLDGMNSAIEIAKTVTRAINTASVAVAQASELLQDARAQLDAFREPLRALRRLGAQSRRFAQGVDALGQWPKAFMQDFWYAVFEVTHAVFDTWAALPFFDRQAARSAMIDTMEVLGAARRDTQTALGLNFVSLPNYVSTYERQTSGGTAGSSDIRLSTRTSSLRSMAPVAGGYAVKSGKLVVVYEVRAGESLMDIAGTVLGDRSRWKDIAELNGMNSSDMFSNGAPLTGGTLLFVPAADGANLTGATPADLYGADLLLSSDGDLIGIGDNPQDVALVRGVDNLRQGLTNRLLTVQGDNATFPDHGLPRLVGDPGTLTRIADAAIEAKIQFKADPRISQITALDVVDEGDTLLVTSTLQPVVGKAFDVAVPFPAAA